MSDTSQRYYPSFQRLYFPYGTSEKEFPKTKPFSIRRDCFHWKELYSIIEYIFTIFWRESEGVVSFFNTTARKVQAFRTFFIGKCTLFFSFTAIHTETCLAATLFCIIVTLKFHSKIHRFLDRLHLNIHSSRPKKETKPETSKVSQKWLWKTHTSEDFWQACASEYIVSVSETVRGRPKIESRKLQRRQRSKLNVRDRSLLNSVADVQLWTSGFQTN